jgi:hypothetical protein
LFTSSASDRLKLQIFRAAVQPILLYGMESVPCTESRETELDASYRALPRLALNIRYPETLPASELAKRAGRTLITIILKQHRQRLVGHVLRRHGRGEANPLAAVILHPPQEGFRRGQAFTSTVIATVTQNLIDLNLTPTDTTCFPSKLFRERLCARAL